MVEVLLWLGGYLTLGLGVLSVTGRFAVEADDTSKELRVVAPLIWLTWPVVLGFFAGYGFVRAAETVMVRSAHPRVRRVRLEREVDRIEKAQRAAQAAVEARAAEAGLVHEGTVVDPRRRPRRAGAGPVQDYDG